MFARTHRLRHPLLITLFAAATLFAHCALASTSPQKRIQAFKRSMITQHQYSPQKLRVLFQGFQPNKKILRAMSNPYEQVSWARYRRTFLTQQRIDAGRSFYKEHQKTLQKATRIYGVPPSIILAILGVETFYGKHTGYYSVFNSLGTLAFYYPKRARFFTKELTAFLLIGQDEGYSTAKLKSIQGSYAGAMGLPQFMPSSIRHYGKAAKANRKLDLYTTDDAIMSIANYLHKNGWRRNQAVATPAVLHTASAEKMLTTRIKTLYSQVQLRKKGITAKQRFRANKAALIDLPKDPKGNYWLVAHNFKVIMRYNPRISYAMAVFQLSQAFHLNDQGQHHAQRTSSTPSRTG
jgi:membrane-bound lytic murein transglycosylase B